MATEILDGTPSTADLLIVQHCKNLIEQNRILTRFHDKPTPMQDSLEHRLEGFGMDNRSLVVVQKQIDYSPATDIYPDLVRIPRASIVFAQPEADPADLVLMFRVESKGVSEDEIEKALEKPGVTDGVVLDVFERGTPFNQIFALARNSHVTIALTAGDIFEPVVNPELQTKVQKAVYEGKHDLARLGFGWTSGEPVISREIFDGYSETKGYAYRQEEFVPAVDFARMRTRVHQLAGHTVAKLK